MGAVAFALGGCEIYPWFYPRFDNPINPDIRDIRSGDVVEGVKCAVTSYLWERAGLVLKNARAEIRAERKCYSPTSAQLAQGRGWIVKYQHYENKESSRDDPCPGGVPPGTHSDAAAQSHAAKKLKGTEEPPKPHRVGIASSDVPDEVHKLVDRLAKLPDKDAAAEIASIEADPWYKCLPHYLDSNGYCKPEAYLFEAKSSKACVSNGGCPPGTLRANNNICLISDSSRFAFDSHSNATIELQLTATNTGTVTYGKIDLAKLGPLTKIFYPAQLNANGTASSLVSAPIIPSAYVKGKASNIVTMQFDLPQSPYIPEAANPTAVKEELNRINNAIRSLARMLGPRQGFFAESVLSLVETPPAPKERQLSDYTGQALAAMRASVAFDTNEAAEASIKQLEDACGRQVDFLALKSFIEHGVNDQEATVFKGLPEVSLNSLVLTTSFQLVTDINADTHLFHIMPLLQPPGFELTPDHTHQIKVTFQGVKSRANPTNAVSLKQKCITRLQGIVSEGPKAESTCDSANALLLESVIDSLENGKGATSGTP